MSAPARSRTRVRAPALAGRRWLGTGGRDLALADLRGKVVLLDFWTGCCVNCVHVLDELRALEQEFADVLVVVGVHSPKFAHEAEPDAVDAAVARYDVRHPVLDDPQLTTWRAYAARAWPTLVVIDPTGYVVASLAGEGHAHELAAAVRELVAEHGAAGTLHRGDGPYVPPSEPASALLLPGAAVALRGGTLLVADTAHHQLVELDADLTTELRRFGTGRRGLHDGAPDRSRFAEPAGVAVLPADVAAHLGWDVAVADGASHAVRGLRVADGHVLTVAGTGRQLRRREGGGPALEQDLATPLAVAWFDGQLVIAMAGTHQLWALEPAPDPRDGVVRVLAGTTAEGVRDGAAEQAWFAQTSGLATSADGGTLWLVDAETSALRRVRRSGGPAPDRAVPVVDDPRMANEAPVAHSGYEVTTVVGTGLFDFGHRDGQASQALMQHPLGLAVLPDGSVAVADTYNGAVRRYDPIAQAVSTLATDLAEPCAVVVDGGGAALVVVESAAHGLVRVPVPAAAQHVDGAAQRVARPPTELAAGPVALAVAFTPPTGQHLDDRWGEPTRLVVSATPVELLVAGAGDAAGLTRELVLSESVTTGVLHISARAAACDSAEGPDGAVEEPEHAACHLHQQDRCVPVRVVDGGGTTLALDLRGV